MVAPKTDTHKDAQKASNKVPVHTKYLRRIGTAFQVSMAWSQLQVTSTSTPSFLQAVDWQIAMMRVRSSAQARMRSGRGNQNPLNDQELSELFMTEPSLVLNFKFSFRLLGHQVATPIIQNFWLAMEFKRRLLDAANLGQAKVEEEKKSMCQQAIVERKNRKQSEQRLAAAVAAEVSKREKAVIKKRKAGQLALPASRLRSKTPLLLAIVDETTSKKAKLCSMPPKDAHKVPQPPVMPPKDAHKVPQPPLAKAKATVPAKAIAKKQTKQTADMPEQADVSKTENQHQHGPAKGDKTRGRQVLDWLRATIGRS